MRIPASRPRIGHRLAVVALLAVLGAGGCGGDQPTAAEPPPAGDPASDPPAASPVPTEATVPSPTPQEPAEPADGVLTEADDGRAVALDLGAEVPIRLDSAWSWGEPRVEGEGVALSRVEYFADPGYVEWVVLGQRAGTAAVEVDGEPACGDPEACPPLTVRFTFEVAG